MRRRKLAVVAASLALCLLPAAGGAVDPQPLEVAVSIAPLAELVERLGGPGVRVTVLAPPGVAPETWSPTPREALVLTRTELYLSVGHPLLAFETGPLESIAAQAEIAGRLRMAAATGAAGGDDPHLWMDPELLASTAQRVATWLVEHRPAQAATVESGLISYLDELRQVDTELGQRLAVAGGRPLVFQHPSWARLLARHGVESLTIELDGKEPSPARLARLIERARAAGVRTVFTQVGVSDRGARVLASEIGAELVALNATAHPWLATLRATGEAFAAAMR